MDPNEIDRIIKPLLMPDLRTELRSRGCTPAGELNTLRERLKENMLQTGNFRLNAGVAQAVGGATANAYQPNQFADGGVPRGEAIGSGNQHGNNYSRPGGQNVGNFLTDKPSSRVLAPPGGGSQIVFGGDVPQQAPPRAQAHQAYASPQHPVPQAANQNQHHAQYVSPTAAQQYQQQPQQYQQPNFGSPQAQNQHYAQYAVGAPEGAAPPRGEAIGSGNQHGNNYSRPGGQNVGNFLTDKPSSRVLAPPGGKSQISFY